MSGQRQRRRSHRDAPLRLVGGLVVAAALLVVYLSYVANDGLPLKPTYDVAVLVPNADRLARRDAVRIGGVRVGQVDDVAPAPQRRGAEPAALIRLKLDRSVGGLPVDSRVKIRPASVLGASYVDLQPGESRETLDEGDVLDLDRALQTVQSIDLFDVFDRSTTRAIQRSIDGFATGLAGRGPQLNATIRSLGHLLGPLSRVSRTLAAPGTRLGEAVRTYDGFVSALAPVAPQLAGFTSAAATTMGALASERDALGRAIDASPATVAAVRDALGALAPSLDRLAPAVASVRRGTGDLPRALDEVNATLRAGVAPLRRVPAVTRSLDPAVTAIDRISRRPSTSGVLRRGREALRALDVTLQALVPAQLQCNVATVWAQNFAAGFGSLGFGDGPAIATVGMTHFGAQGESMQNAAPSPNVAINNVPNLDRGECESGNEPYDGKQALGNPAGLQEARTLTTRPPAGVRERARRAGLLEDEGAGR